MVMNDSFEEIFEEGLFENKETLEEILLRLVLLFDLGTKKIEGINNISITVDVRNTIFQFSNLFKPEAFHRYDAYLQLYSNALSSILYIIADNEFKVGRSLNSVKPYFNLIYRCDRKWSKHLGFGVTDSIIEWNKYFKEGYSLSWAPDLYLAKVDLSPKPIVEINREAAFIKNTDPLIKKLELELRKDVQKSFIRQFGIQYEQILQFIEVVKENNPPGIRSFLDANFPYSLFKMDLVLSIIDFPDLEDIDLEEYEMHFDEELIANILKLDKEDMITTIIKFNELVIGVIGYDPDYDSNKALRSCLPDAI